MGVLEVLTLIFLILKVTEYGDFADWSWWAVFAPLWIGYGVVFAFWLLGVIFVGLFGGRR